MTDASRARRWCVACPGLALVAVLGGAASSSAPERYLLGVQAKAAVDVHGERRIRISGVEGKIRVWGGELSELRWECSALDGSEREVPVAVSTDESTFEVAAPEGQTMTGVRLDVLVPEAFSVEVATRKSEVAVLKLSGDVSVRGADLEVDLRNLAGYVALDVGPGTVRGSSLDGDLRIEGEDVEASLGPMEGTLETSLTGGKLSLTQIGGAADLDLTDCDLVVEHTGAPFRVRASGGSARVTRLSRGAHLDLSRTPLELSDSRGEISIVTDADVELTRNGSGVRVDGYGGAVRASANGGALQIRTQGASVQVDKNVGGVTVEGDGLEIGLQGVEGDVGVRTTGSTVRVSNAKGSVSVENDFGDVTVQGAGDGVRVVSRGGSVYLRRVSGPVDVRADGPEVTVAWATLSLDKDSSIRNDGGDVTVQFPGRGGCRIEARARFGTIDSGLRDVHVSADGGYAVGMLNRRRQPQVRVEASGAIQLTGRGSRRSPRARERQSGTAPGRARP